MAKILAIRFSALGDVAMTIPVIFSFARAFPQHQVVVLSRPFMKGLFKKAPGNVQFFEADTKSLYHGLKGLDRLYRKLNEDYFDAVSDLHDVLRSKYLRFRFRMAGIPVAHIDKGRKEKRRLTSPNNKKLVQLPDSFQRYTEVFRKLGYAFPLNFTSVYDGKPADISELSWLTGEKKDGHWIGIAPFAAHKGKIYPIEKTEEIVKTLASHQNIKVFLFGGGKAETDVFTAWTKKYPQIVSVAGKLKMEQELALMSHLDAMFTMDSGNMHLASLVNIPVISVWGATHPYAGFRGWNQSQSNIIQADLPCRPCSVYGNKPCKRKDYACLNSISPGQILSRIAEAADLDLLNR